MRSAFVRNIIIAILLTVSCFAEEANQIKPIIAKTVIEAVKFTSPALSVELRAEIIKLENPDLMIKYHHGLGTWVRNNCGLWEKDSPLIKSLTENSMGFDGHPDSASHIILCALWAYERGRSDALSGLKNK